MIWTIARAEVSISPIALMVCATTCELALASSCAVTIAVATSSESCAVRVTSAVTSLSACAAASSRLA